MRSSLSAAVAVAALAGLAQPSLAGPYDDPATMAGAITGTMKVDFKTRVALDRSGKLPEGSPELGAQDKYTVNLKVADSVVIVGDVLRQPWIPYASTGLEAQRGGFRYDLRFDLRNPKNPAQVRPLGKWTGSMTVDGAGKYRLDQPLEGSGPLRIAIDPVGNIPGFTGAFAGEIQGRRSKQVGLMGLVSSAQSTASKQYRRVTNQGQVVTIEVANADPMQFVGASAAAGPLAGYPQTRLSGSMDYDPENSIWHLDLNAAYNLEGRELRDRFSGSIRWNEDPARSSNGKGWYDLNVRVNEKPVAAEAVAFADAANAEDAFFAEDVTVPGFIGKINYVDTLEGERVVASNVTYAVDANQASKAQAMNFTKILLLAIGPFNDE